MMVLSPNTSRLRALANSLFSRSTIPGSIPQMPVMPVIYNINNKGLLDPAIKVVKIPEQPIVVEAGNTQLTTQDNNKLLEWLSRGLSNVATGTRKLIKGTNRNYSDALELLNIISVSGPISRRQEELIRKIANTILLDKDASEVQKQNIKAVMERIEYMKDSVYDFKHAMMVEMPPIAKQYTIYEKKFSLRKPDPLLFTVEYDENLNRDINDMNYKLRLYYTLLNSLKVDLSSLFNGINKKFSEHLPPVNLSIDLDFIDNEQNTLTALFYDPKLNKLSDSSWNFLSEKLKGNISIMEQNSFMITILTSLDDMKKAFDIGYNDVSIAKFHSFFQVYKSLFPKTEDSLDNDITDAFISRQLNIWGRNLKEIDSIYVDQGVTHAYFVIYLCITFVLKGVLSREVYTELTTDAKTNTYFFSRKYLDNNSIDLPEKEENEEYDKYESKKRVGIIKHTSKVDRFKS